MMKFSSAFLALVLAAASHATVLDFEDLSGTDYGFFADYGPSVSTHGYVLSGGDIAGWTSGAANTGYTNYTGSKTLFENNPGNVQITLAKADGGAFDLLSLDVANLYLQSYHQGTTTITFRGLHADGTFVSQSSSTSSIDGTMKTVTLSGFTGLTSFTFYNSNPQYAQFDNVMLNAVPEPSVFAAFGIGALTLMRRRRIVRR